MRLKRFLMASALALSFTVSAPAVAKADPITAAVVAWTGFTGAAAAVATFVVNTALYAAGSWAVTKAAKALGLMKSSVAERQASVTTLSLGETPREAVVGVACIGGSLIDAWNHGGKYGTDYVTRRVALADHVLDGLIGYYLDDTYYPFVANGAQPGFGATLQLTFVNATRDGAFPPPYMLQAGVGLTSADRCPSVAEIWITYKFDDQVWTRGHPGLKFVVRGLRTYDPRFDPQFGYTGPAPQIWDDVSTHRFSENAAVVRYNIQRGIYAVGRHGELEHLLIGRGLSAAEAPAGRIIAAANVCDEIVDGLPRYTVGGAISSAQAHIEVEEMFAAATAGQIVQRDGGVEVEPGQAKAAVVTITDADLVAGQAISFDEFTPDTDGGRVNTVIARYVEPSQLYKDHSGAVLRDQADIVEDGGPRELTLPLMLVTNKGQADRCAEITRRGARLERRARIALVPMLLAGRASAELEDGDIIAWQSNRYHEGATVRYRIEAYGVDEGWRNTLQLREMASSVFGQADPVEDRAAPPPAPTPIDALQLVGVQAEAITLPGETSTLPAVRFSWNVTTDDTAMTAIRAEVRRVGETDAAPTRIDDVAKGQANVTNGVGPDQALECRLVPIGDPSRPVLASNWITVSTSTIVAGDLSPESPTRIAVSEITDRLVSVEQISATNAAAVADLEEVFGDTASAAASAVAAAASASTAAQAEADAIIAQGAAQSASQSALDQALAAAGSASAALTSRNQASTFATNASNSATSASGSASTATTQAGLAANSATAAGGSATAAAGSASTATTKATDAGESATAASASKVAAESARDSASGSATAAASSASSAATSATNAGTSASAASQSKLDAQTAQSAAGVSATNAANSATNAAESASTASTQAGLATTAKNDAAGSASGALTSRNQASGFATAAETAAAASSASSVTAIASKDAAKNYAINQGSITPSALLWTNNPNGVPETATDATYPVVTVGGKPSMILGDNQHVFWKRAVPFVAGHVYEIQVEVEPSTALAAEISLIIWQLDGSYANLPAQNYQLTSKSIPVRGLYTQRFTPNAATVWLRPAVKGEMVGSKNPRIFSLNIIDVTAQAAAEASATAASTSASSAAASETAAGQSASAANTAKVAAETARGQAEAFKNETASSRDTATAQAALATAQAGLSAGSATLAGQKAGASSDSASLASTKADEAGASAAASRADQISASAARDQALAALMAQGRQNLVARENVASGQLVAVSSGGASGWGFSIVGSGGNVTRTIKVGPLKANTAYSISFKARRTSGSGSLPINVDLNPDTLPERTFDIQSSALTEFKWENITSPSTDMALATVHLRFFRAPLPTGYAYEITDIKLEEGATATAWTPSPKDAAYSASASATSAASAAASDTAAGQSATAASGSATTASTKAGEASTFASQASTSAGNAAGSATTASTASGVAVTARDQANAARDAAQGSAATALAQAANASASASAASISANLAASVGAPRGQLLYNSTGNRGMDGWAGGPSWFTIDVGYGFGRVFQTNTSGLYFYNDISHCAAIGPGDWVTWSADPKIVGGTCEIWLEFYDANLNPISGSYGGKQVSNRDFGATISGEVLAPNNAFNARLVVFPKFSPGGSAGVCRMKVERGRLPATAWSDEETTKAIAAQLNITAAVAADVATRMASVEFSVTGGAGGDPFDISLKAGPTGSDASITATKVRLRNIVNGEAIEALRIENGKSKFFGDVEVNGGSMNFNNRFIVAQDGTTTIRSGQTGERMWIEGKTIRGWYANGQQAYQLG